MKKMLAFALAAVFALGFASMASAGGNADNGASLWGSKKCKNCHNMDAKKKVGPGLAKVFERRAEEWLVKWLKDPKGTWLLDDPDTNELKEETKAVGKKKPKMKIGKLSDEEVADLIAYMKANGG